MIVLIWMSVLLGALAIGLLLNELAKQHLDDWLDSGHRNISNGDDE